MKKIIATLAIFMIMTTLVFAEKMWRYPDGSLHDRLPKKLKTATCIIYPATQERFEKAGYRLETDAEEVRRIAKEEEMKHSMPLTFTKRDLLKALESQGLKNEFVAFISSDDDAKFWWDACIQLSTEDVDFKAAIEIVKSQLGLTDEQLRGLFELAAWNNWDNSQDSNE